MSASDFPLFTARDYSAVFVPSGSIQPTGRPAIWALTDPASATATLKQTLTERSILGQREGA